MRHLICLSFRSLCTDQGNYYKNPGFKETNFLGSSLDIIYITQAYSCTLLLLGHIHRDKL